MSRKTDMREQMKASRAGLSAQDRASLDAGIAQQLFASPEWQQARAVLTYLGFGAEIDTHAIIEQAWQEGKIVALPRVVEARESAAPAMRWFAVTSFDALQKSALGVQEPPADPACEVQPADLCVRYGRQSVLALVPGLAFDRRGYRLGYGGGYYDAFLSRFAGRSIGLCRSAFAVDCLECVESHDVPVDAVLTECGVLVRDNRPAGDADNADNADGADGADNADGADGMDGMDGFRIRFATRSDCGLVLRFIKDLAEYERMSDCVIATEELLADWLFERHTAEVVFAVADGREVGFALFFSTFSTFLGRAGMHLEDLYVVPQERGKGYGKALLAALARICLERGYGRLEWQCLDWNEPSIGFYRSLGAVQLDDWIDFRVTGDALRRLSEL